MRKILSAVAVSVLVVAASPAACGGVHARSADGYGSELMLISSLDAREELLSADADGSAEHEGGEPAKMFALSLIVPGAGQLAQGEKRGYLYLLAEVAFWAGFYVLDTKGLDERGDYEAYADDHWNDVDYYAWYQDNCVDCGEDCAGDYDCRPLGEYGTQEFYEDIGKYKTYWRWWNPDGDEGDIDWDGYSDDDVYFRDIYWGMRDESNRHLRQARHLMMAALLNHVVSGVDSFLSARRGDADAGSRERDIGLEFGVPDNEEGLTCALVARY